MTTPRRRRPPRAQESAPDLPDVRDGLTRKERIVLFQIAKLEEELAGRNVPLPMLYGRVLEHVDLAVAELVAIVARLGAKRAPTPKDAD